VLVSGGGSNFTDLGGDKIEIAGDVSECERLCWECCRSNRLDCGDGAPQTIRDCNCDDTKPTEV